jgi:hypothetical protein
VMGKRFIAIAFRPTFESCGYWMDINELLIAISSRTLLYQVALQITLAR